MLYNKKIVILTLQKKKKNGHDASFQLKWYSFYLHSIQILIF